GHMIIDIDGPKCNCGNFGCLEAHSSGIAIQRRVKEEIISGFVTSIADPYIHEEIEPTIYKIVEEAREGDKLALQVLHEAERYLRLGIANAINLFSPNQIIFGGEVTKLYPEMIIGVEKLAKQHAFSPHADQITYS